MCNYISAQRKGNIYYFSNSNKKYYVDTHKIDKTSIYYGNLYDNVPDDLRNYCIFLHTIVQNNTIVQYIGKYKAKHNTVKIMYMSINHKEWSKIYYNDDHNRDLYIYVSDYKEVKVSMDRTTELQYNNLRKNLNEKLIEPFLGNGYYNMGLDVYTCDEFTIDDLAKLIIKGIMHGKLLIISFIINIVLLILIFVLIFI